MKLFKAVELLPEWDRFDKQVSLEELGD